MTDQIDRINFLRAKVRDGEAITKEEQREALNLIREQRKGILDKQTKKETKGAIPLNLNDLFTTGETKCDQLKQT